MYWQTAYSPAPESNYPINNFNPAQNGSQFNHAQNHNSFPPRQEPQIHYQQEPPRQYQQPFNQQHQMHHNNFYQQNVSSGFEHQTWPQNNRNSYNQQQYQQQQQQQQQHYQHRHPNHNQPKFQNKQHSNNHANVNHAKETLKCKPCERNFNNTAALEAHQKTHVECEQEGCSFIASSKAVKLHFIQTHAEGKFRICLQTPEEIQKWKEERKRNWPTPDNIARKKAKLQEDERDGIIVETKEYTYHESEGRSGRGKRGRNRGRGGIRERGRRGRNQGRQGRANQDSLPCDILTQSCNNNFKSDTDSSLTKKVLSKVTDTESPEKTEVTQPEVADSSKNCTEQTEGPQLKVIDYPINGNKNTEVTENSMDIAEKTEVPPSIKHDSEKNNLETISNGRSGLGLLQAYSEDEGGNEETVGNVSKLVTTAPATIDIINTLTNEKPEIEKETGKTEQEKCDITLKEKEDGELSETESIPETQLPPTKQLVRSVTNVDDKNQCENPQDEVDTNNNLSNDSMVIERKNGRQRRRKNKTEQKKQQALLNKQKVSLLEMLLANEIRHERNVILQCIRYTVNENFFGS